MIMEQKLVKVPFEVEMAKKITNGATIPAMILSLGLDLFHLKKYLN